MDLAKEDASIAQYFGLFVVTGMDQSNYGYCDHATIVPHYHPFAVSGFSISDDSESVMACDRSFICVSVLSVKALAGTFGGGPMVRRGTDAEYSGIDRNIADPVATSFVCSTGGSIIIERIRRGAVSVWNGSVFVLWI